MVTACMSGGAPETTASPTNTPTTVLPTSTKVAIGIPTSTPAFDVETAKTTDSNGAKIFIAHAFLDARNAYDAETATSLFAPDAHIHEAERPTITSVDMYPALFEWLRATGWQWMVDECHVREGRQANTVCTYRVENAWSRAMGLAPVDGGIALEIWGPMNWVPDFDVNLSAGYGDNNAQMVDVWETVTDWIRANHPTDVGAMIGPTGYAPVLDARSIDLWRTYTQEFVEAFG
jgi:hypothetical protein